MVRVFSLLALAMALVLSGCASRVDYGDAQARETVTADFGSTDLQMIATKMVDDMMVFPPIVEMTRDRRPVLFSTASRTRPARTSTPNPSPTPSSPS